MAKTLERPRLSREQHRSLRRWLWYGVAYILLIYIALRLGGATPSPDGSPIGD